MSLNNICYEHIKDSYYYGLFGDFKLVIDKTTGCFNATKLCNLGGKQYRDWKRLEKSKELIKTLINVRRENSRVWEYNIISNNNHEIHKQYTGYYVSKDLILDIASWIAPEFYLKCNDIIINYYNNEFKSLSKEDINNKIKEVENKYTNIIVENEITIKQKDDKIDELNNKLDIIITTNKILEQKSTNLENINNKLLKLAEKQNIKLDEISDELDETNYKLDTLTQTVEENILPDRNIQPNDINLKHNLVIYKKINNIIKITRAQNKYINKIKISEDNIIIKEYVPNPIDFINRMKLYCIDLNKKIKLSLRKNNKNISYDEFIDIYNINKKFEIKYNNIILNNSNLDDVILLFNKLKEEQYNY
ncbi:hypothetical protein AMV110 [Betaentomopoxvirus amoorei]|uniref:AMV110 n=1 Tax=Amsacta moorei entomopoxvirus TaxID=28321 RepID=Q9EMT9_AMEPV|nr:hypothetical protein AMV110 [Amsacta moorei entomopoxvirus]AAG02816.1 AMV110 [Amsacta moorei entomopoxvirus]